MEADQKYLDYDYLCYMCIGRVQNKSIHFTICFKIFWACIVLILDFTETYK